MSDQESTYKFNVSMSCGGCSGAVERVLKKLDGAFSSFLATAVTPLCPPVSRLDSLMERNLLGQLSLERGVTDGSIKHLGVKSYDVSLDTQTVLVKAEPSLEYDTVLNTIKKTGKTVNSGEVVTA
jgi:copper chaperone